LGRRARNAGRKGVSRETAALRHRGPNSPDGGLFLSINDENSSLSPRVTRAHWTYCQGRCRPCPNWSKKPKFVALWVAIWAFMVLGVVNIITKINLLMQLTAE